MNCLPELTVDFVGRAYSIARFFFKITAKSPSNNSIFKFVVFGGDFFGRETMNIVTKCCEGHSKMRMQELLQGCKPVKKFKKSNTLL